MIVVTRGSRRVRWLDHFVQDVRVSCRALLKNRGFTAVTVLTLTVGIGATTAIFSLVEGVLLTPLPYPDAHRIVRVAAEALPRTGLAGIPFSEAGYLHFFENNRSFEAFGGYSSQAGGEWRIPLLGDGLAQEVVRMPMRVSAFEVLGVMPQLGRLPTLEEERRIPVAPVVLISYGLWMDRYGADRSIIGRTISLRDWQAEVIGVMPEGFDFPNPEIDVWTLDPIDPESESVAGHFLLGIGRLAPGVTIQEATADAEALIAGFDELGYSPERLASLFSGKAIVRPLMDEIVRDAREPLLIALGTAVFVLLIACGNVANLLLVRAESRAREHAVRMALGSGRGRLIQSAMMESALLTLAGAVGGVALAYIGIQVLVSAGPSSIPRLAQIGIDGIVLFVATVVSVAAGLLCGFVPAVRAGSSHATRVLRSGGPNSTIAKERHRVLGGLVVAQLALALVLVVGSGLMVKSFHRLRSVHPGFDAEGVMTFRPTQPSTRKYRNATGVDFGLYWNPLLERLAALPGVTSVGAVSSLPLTGVVGMAGSTLGPVEIEEFPTPDGGLRPNFLTVQATPLYFETMGIPILEGRPFVGNDYSSDYSSTAFIISAAVKRRYWPAQSALGKVLTYGILTGPVVGVAGNVHHRGLNAPPDEIIYYAGFGRHMTIAVRTAGDPGLLVPGIRAAAEQIDPEVPITHVQSMVTILRNSHSRMSFMLTLLALAAGVGLFLGSIGIYGVLAWVAKRRTTEMGVRLALGADPSTVRNLILSRGMMLAGLGAAIGMAGSMALGGVLDSLLFRVSPLDLTTLAGASAVFLGVAALASIGPARQAARTSPVVALRAES